MAHFAPHLIRSRRRRMMAAQRASCGIALASFRLNAEGGPSEEMILLPVSTAYVANVLEFNTLRNLSDTDKRFVNRLALHPDVRLRTTAAAVEEGLLPGTVRKLAKDPAFAVRRELSRNEDALGKLTAAECVQLTQNDTSLIVNVLNTFVRIVLNADLALDDEDPDRLEETRKETISAVEKLRFMVCAFKDHSDRGVRDEVFVAEEDLREMENDPEFFVPVKKTKLSKLMKKRALRESFVGNSGEYAVGFVFLDETALSAGNVALDTESPVLRIPVDAYHNVIRNLPNGEPRDVFLERLAANANACIRETVAQVECLPKAALDLLKTDDNYDVRLALLQNECALTELTEQEIIALIRSDMGLVRDAFEYVEIGARMRSILEKAFEDSDDPNVWELLEAVSE